MTDTTPTLAAAPGGPPENLEFLLQQDLPSDVVLIHPQSKVDYVPGFYVISRLNKVFGHLGWSVSYGEPVASLSGTRTIVRVVGTLTVEASGRRVTRTDVGVAISAGDKPEAIETAYKSAFTDCLKRCARGFGPSFGLALYDKERSTVGGSTETLPYLEEIAKLMSLDACDQWVAQRSETLKKTLSEDDRAYVKDAYRARRAELASVGAVAAAASLTRVAVPEGQGATDAPTPQRPASVPPSASGSEQPASAPQSPTQPARQAARPSAPEPVPQRPLLERVLEAIGKAGCAAELQAVRRQYGPEVRRLAPADYERVKRAASDQEATWSAS